MTAIGAQFSIVPIEAISDPELTPSEFKVLVALYSFRDKNADTTYPKLDKLAARGGFKDPTQVSKITSRLEGKGWLTKRQKMGFHGPKKYRLTIPDRLLPGGENFQLGENYQLGETDHIKPSNLEDLSNLEEGPITNLDKTTNSQLGENYQDYKNIPVRTDTVEQTSSDAIASATAAAKPVDNFKSIQVDYQSPSADQLIFNRGAEFLGRYQIPPDAARKFLGMCKSKFGLGRALDAVVVSIFSQPARDPKAFMLGVLANQPRPIDQTWGPSDATVSELEALGMPTDLIKNARGVFVTWFSDMEIQHSDWPRLFKDWVIRDWERAEFKKHHYRTILAASAGLEYGTPFCEPPGGTL